MKPEILFKDESYQILGACFEVYNELGYGFLESVYQESLALELHNQRIPFVQKPRLTILYKDQTLSQFFEADFLCFDEIILEIKAVKELINEHRAQVINYLKATDKRLGLLINFGHYPGIQQERLLN